MFTKLLQIFFFLNLLVCDSFISYYQKRQKFCMEFNNICFLGNNLSSEGFLFFSGFVPSFAGWDSGFVSDTECSCLEVNKVPKLLLSPVSQGNLVLY